MNLNLNTKKQKLIAVGLGLLVLILAGISVWVAIRISQKQAVAPTAPTSKPKAGNFVGSEACNTSFTIAASPTTTPAPACGSACDNDNQCPTGLECFILEGGDTWSGLCRNPACEFKADCDCALTPTVTTTPIPGSCADNFDVIKTANVTTVQAGEVITYTVRLDRITEEPTYVGIKKIEDVVKGTYQTDSITVVSGSLGGSEIAQGPITSNLENDSQKLTWTLGGPSGQIFVLGDYLEFSYKVKTPSALTGGDAITNNLNITQLDSDLTKTTCLAQATVDVSAPTNTPTDIPTNTPTDIPTNTPTNTPTSTTAPTNTPTSPPEAPEATATNLPTNTPTLAPGTTAANTPTPIPKTLPETGLSLPGVFVFTGGLVMAILGILLAL